MPIADAGDASDDQERKLTDSNQRALGENDEQQHRKLRDKRGRLPIKVIAALLQPHESLSGRPFEVKIDFVCYVGVLWHIQRSVQCISVIFALPAAANPGIIDAYQKLSRKLAIAINTEQNRCGFLRDELQIIEPFLDRAANWNEGDSAGNLLAYAEGEPPYAEIEANSSLARTLRLVYEDAYSYGIVDVYVNDCIEVEFCVDPKCVMRTPSSASKRRDDSEASNASRLQPYHTILFYEDVSIYIL